MPPRYAYWTILVDEQPTAFRAGDRDDLQPTFKRLQAKHPSARMVWFQNGKIWASRLDAQEAMRARGEMGRRGDVRQAGGFRDRARDQRQPERDDRDASGKLKWKPKGTFTQPPAEGRRSAKREGPLEWKPKGAPGTARPSTARPSTARPSTARPRTQDPRPKTWRPGGEHRDPRQKYKDAKKAKWGRFKQAVRKRWESKQGRKKKDGE